MPLQEKVIHVRVSLGQNNTDRLPREIEDYAMDINHSYPRSVWVVGADRDQDLLALQTAALSKMESISKLGFGPEMPHRANHVIDPDEPGTWTENGAHAGLVYRSSDDTGKQFFIGFEIH